MVRHVWDVIDVGLGGHERPLRLFDTYDKALEYAKSMVPVIEYVGHEPDDPECFTYVDGHMEHSRSSLHIVINRREIE